MNGCCAGSLTAANGLAEFAVQPRDQPWEAGGPDGPPLSRQQLQAGQLGQHGVPPGEHVQGERRAWECRGTAHSHSCSEL